MPGASPGDAQAEGFGFWVLHSGVGFKCAGLSSFDLGHGLN